MIELLVEGELRWLEGVGDVPLYVDIDVVRHRSQGPIPTLGSDLTVAQESVRDRCSRSIAATRGARRVLVIGDGVLAETLRHRLGPLGQNEAVNSPAAAIDTTGENCRIVDALRTLPIGGTLVLAAWPPHPELRLDAYLDLHRTGVVVTGPLLELPPEYDHDAGQSISAPSDVGTALVSASAKWVVAHPTS